MARVEGGYRSVGVYIHRHSRIFRRRRDLMDEITYQCVSSPDYHLYNPTSNNSASYAAGLLDVGQVFDRT